MHIEWPVRPGRGITYAIGLVAWVICLAPAALGAPATRPAALPGFGRTCEILLAFPEGPDIEAIERAIGLDPATRRVIGKQGDRELILQYTRSDGLVASFGIRFVPAGADSSQERFVYVRSQVVRLRNKVWISWRLPDFRRVDYFGLADGAPKDSLPFDPLAD